MTHPLRRLPIPSAPMLWAIVVGWVLLNDAVLVAQGRETMSDWYGRNAKALGLVAGYLLFHLHGRPRFLSRLDPLHLGANVIRARFVTVIPEVAFRSNSSPVLGGLHIEMSPTTATQWITTTD